MAPSRADQPRVPRLRIFQLMDVVYHEDCPLTILERAVAICIGKHADRHDHDCQLSLETIKGRTGAGRTALREAIEVLCEGEQPLFDRIRGGARSGDRYSSSVYVIRPLEGFAWRGAHVVRGSRGGLKGVATRLLGGRHANAEHRTEHRTEHLPSPKSPSHGAGGSRTRRYEEQLERIREAVRPYGVYTDRRWARETANRLLAGEELQAIVDGYREAHEQAERGRAEAEAIRAFHERERRSDIELAEDLCDFVQSHQHLTRREAKAAWGAANAVPDTVLMLLGPSLTAVERRLGIEARERDRSRAEDLEMLRAMRESRAPPQRLAGTG